MGNEDQLIAVRFVPGMETATSPGSMVLLTRLARVVHRRSTEQLLGMRVKQFATLCFVRDRGGVLQSDLADALYMDANNLVLLLNDLEAHGWIERRRDPEDRRRHIVEEEWPRMREGNDSAHAWADVNAIFAVLQRFEPKSPSAVAFYDDSVRQLNLALDARRNRLDDAGGGLPWVVGALLFVGSLVIVGYAVLIGSRSFWFHAIGAGAIVLIIGMSLVVLVALIYPFSGDLAIDPGPFQNGSLAEFFGPSS